MAIEAALIKPVVDALLGLFRQGENLHLKRNAETALREAIRELLLANPNDSKAEARIAIAKAAGIISEDVVLAEKMLSSTRANAARTRGKGSVGTPRKTAADASGKPEKAGDKTSSDKAPAKKAVKAAAKPVPKKPAKKS